MDLQDVTVIDLTRLLPGPFASQILADFGAEVIKIDDPAVGD
jgi:crotonobetainyl-CoA:carnitine CoA-transferase CaiB-like acyl-CoA transferase